MKKLTLTILIMVLIICFGCSEFSFNFKPENKLTEDPVAAAPIPTIADSSNEPIFEDPISIEDLVADNQEQIEELVKKDKKIDHLEKVVTQNQKAMNSILAENANIKKDTNAIKSLITKAEPLPDPSIEPHIQTIVESSNKIGDLTQIGPVEIPLEIGPIDPSLIEPTQSPSELTQIQPKNIKLIWLGSILGILGLVLFVRFFFFKN